MRTAERLPCLRGDLIHYIYIYIKKNVTFLAQVVSWKALRIYLA
jgi:hypothetical protein